jgi:diguanylate cyclase (GGDEF)-like protein
MKILVAEADSNGNGPIARLFRTASFHDNPDFPMVIEAVHVAESIDRLLDIFHREHPDVVLVNGDDLGPRVFELCRSIRAQENDRHCGIIIYSLHGSEANTLDLDKILAVGADDLIDHRVGEHEFLGRLHSVYRFKLMTDRLRSANHQLKLLSLTDELTGLSNMRSFNIEYQKMITQCRDKKSGLGLIMFDLDRFKRINDTANHLVGSFIISEIGYLLRFSGVLTPDSLAARYGGDEYIVAIPADGVQRVWAVAEKMHELILCSVFKKDQYSFKLTASFGVAWADPGFEGKSDDLIRGADLMLYRSKRLGRNQVNGLYVRYPIDFDNIGESHLISSSSLSDPPAPAAKRTL